MKKIYENSTKSSKYEVYENNMHLNYKRIFSSCIPIKIHNLKLNKDDRRNEKHLDVFISMDNF